jgi:hypothetical protein
MKCEANLNEASHSFVGSSSRDAAEMSLGVRDKSAEVDAYKAKRNIRASEESSHPRWSHPHDVLEDDYLAALLAAAE